MSFKSLATNLAILVLCTGFTLVAFVIPRVNAMSCIPPVLNDETIEAADLIFQGKVLEAGPEPDSSDLQGMERAQDFVFSVDKVWKGSVDSDRITISRNVYWGDGFTLDTGYLVVSQMEDGQYHAPLCGNTTHIMSAGDKLEILNMKFGKTHNKRK